MQIKPILDIAVALRRNGSRLTDADYASSVIAGNIFALANTEDNALQLLAESVSFSLADTAVLGEDLKVAESANALRKK